MPFFVALVPLAWLVPNHYSPWVSAWQDGMALAGVGLAFLCVRRCAALPLAWFLFIALAMTSVLLQWLTGRMLFGGDAWMVGLYLGAFAAAICTGSALPARVVHGSTSALEFLAVSMVLAAVLSVSVALVQWTGALQLGLLGVDLPPGERPFGNVAQPNHFATLTFLGLCSTGLLRESGVFGKAGARAVALFLLLGLVMSVSRTGWLQYAVLVIVLLALRHRSPSQVGWRELLAGACVLALLTLAWPGINEALLLSPGRTPLQDIDGSGRVSLWLAMVDAILREPLWGYGWHQMVLAQQAVALDHPPFGMHFEHSHNLVLDLMLWVGIPLALVLIGLAAVALWRLARSVTDSRSPWLLAGVFGVLVHALLEYPHEYAYFLVPVGLFLGALHAMAGAAGAQRQLSWPGRALGVAWLGLFAAVAAEYLEVEQNYRVFRLESARIGTFKVESRAPDLRWLTQMQAFLGFARTEARVGLTAAELESMRRTSLRFAFPPAMFRYALATGLNADPAAAEHTLQVLCRVHSRKRCDEGRDSWREAQRRFPALAAVRFPAKEPVKQTHVEATRGTPE